MKTASIIAIAGLATAAGAQTVIDLSGISVDGAAPTTFTVFQNDHGAMTTLDFDLTVEVGATNASWGSEVHIAMTHLPSGFTFTADGSDTNFADLGADDLIFGWGNSGGVFSFQGSIDMSGMGPSDTFGEWEITLSDEFDDFGIDHTYLQGSTITINKVPAPGALAVIGLGGLALSRRRR
ncbi:MAG TPA: PEP-CTERM sorting domain-containing protein [Phycisphaerales bacterium]|nr:PEP-CTERM sorting domain-containing protein [Phycisphaerales bacterium]